LSDVLISGAWMLLTTLTAMVLPAGCAGVVMLEDGSAWKSAPRRGRRPGIPVKPAFRGLRDRRDEEEAVCRRPGGESCRQMSGRWPLGKFRLRNLAAKLCVRRAICDLRAPGRRPQWRTFPVPSQ
jgi:hypothetical protein